MWKVIDSRQVERDYQMTGTEAIVENEKGERLLICDGFGGITSPEGGAVRWRHGLAASLCQYDTFGILDAGEWNEETTLLQAVLRGLDDRRQVLYIDPTNIAKAAGLAT